MNRRFNSMAILLLNSFYNDLAYGLCLQGRQENKE